VPGPHNAGFAPDREPTIHAGVAAFTPSVFELLGRPGDRSEKDAVDQRKRRFRREFRRDIDFDDLAESAGKHVGRD
jgi:hypothetical protein